MSKYQYVDSLCTIKNKEWLFNQRKAGKILTAALKECEKKIKPGISTLKLNEICEDFITSYEGFYPTFKNYKGFPCALCVSINNEIVHGIPRDDKIINEGDIVKLDSGVTYKGAIADKAITIVVGEYKNIKHKLLVDYGERALIAAINFFKFEKNHFNRVGDIGYAIEKEAKKINANVVIDLGGHGLELNCLHGSPFVPNNGEKGKGAIIHTGMTIAIEPILTFGNPSIKLMNDGWTVTINNVGVHWEHTVFVHEDRVEIITGEENEAILG